VEDEIAWGHQYRTHAPRDVIEWNPNPRAWFFRADELISRRLVGGWASVITTHYDYDFDLMSPSTPLRIEAVSPATRFDRFLNLQHLTYRHDPNWVPPLRIECLERVFPRKNPVFEHLEAGFWIATRNGLEVGRISAQVDRLAQQAAHPGLGYFGMFECENNLETALALFQQAEAWLREHGMSTVRGPFSLSINEESGLLVDGFDTRPMILMGHAPPYYQCLLEAAGYRKAKDLYAYLLDIRKRFSPDIYRLIARGEASPRIRMRRIDMKHYAREVAVLFSVFNDAWQDNWGFVPFTEAEMRHTAQSMKPLMQAHRVYICEYDGEPAAMMVTLPNINQFLTDLDGKLLPFGWAKLLWRLRFRYPVEVRVPLMGVRQALQKTRSGALMALMMIEASRREVSQRGGCWAELSWILEDNQAMCKLLDQIGCRIYKTYRIYEKSIS